MSRWRWRTAVPPPDLEGCTRACHGIPRGFHPPRVIRPRPQSCFRFVRLPAPSEVFPMVLADFDFQDAFLSFIWIFFLVIFFWLIITICSDLFADDSVSGWGKAGWIFFLIILPFLG